MKTEQPLWGRGQMVSPRHFQQQAAYAAWPAECIARLSLSRPWGMIDATFEPDALKLGRLQARHLHVRFPDGTLIDTDNADALLPALPLDGESHEVVVVLALPLLRANGSNCLKPDEVAERPVRYRQRWRDVRNTFGEDTRQIAVMQPELTLRFAHQTNSDYLPCPVARLQQDSQGAWLLDETFLPPLLTIQGSRWLVTQLEQLMSQLRIRLSRLMAMRRESNERMADFAVADVSLFWLLNALNSAEPMLGQFQRNPQSPPERLYPELSRLAGSLLTFSLEHQVSAIPAWRHEQLNAVFPPLFDLPGDLPEASLPSRVVALELDYDSQLRFWQAAIPGEGISVWRESSAPSSIAAWVTTGESPAMQQQVLMNSLMSWFHQHVKAVFMDENPDVSVIAPGAVLWGMGPILAGSLATSAWTAWLSRHTAMQHVAGWQPVGTDSTVMSLFPDFVLPLLPEGQGLTWRCAPGIFTLAAVAALLSSGWNNRQLLHRVSFDIARYDRISMDDYGPKADAVAVLRDDAAQLDGQARNGVPLRMSMGLQGERLRMPVLDAVRSYVPPPPPPKPRPKPKPVPKIVRLDSMSLFDSGKSALKAGSTKMLINSLVGIKAKPGWLIVVAGHTDNTGNVQLNQTLSQKRAEAVRDWMRDTGDVPESCFAVQGYGASRPVATNDTPDGRALNRRVEISLVPQASACQIPGHTQASSQDDDVSQSNGE